MNDETQRHKYERDPGIVESGVAILPLKIIIEL